ncbi:hypothetical protein H6G82_28035 [Planktothricoides sp. FACHB-1261]|nr:hypothetical protein [Planktothricoides raciborskii FACHB-1261]
MPNCKKRLINSCHCSLLPAPTPYTFICLGDGEAFPEFFPGMLRPYKPQTDQYL